MERRIFVAGIITAVLVIILCIRALICNSDWYINNELSSLNLTNAVLKDNVYYSYRTEYKDEKMKFYVAIENPNVDVINFGKGYIGDREIFKLELLDKDDFKLTDANLTFDDFNCNDNGYCRGTTTIRIKKDVVKDIKKINVMYNKIITTRTDGLYIPALFR